MGELCPGSVPGVNPEGTMGDTKAQHGRTGPAARQDGSGRSTQDSVEGEAARAARKERIAQLRRSILAGTYRIPSDAVADRVIDAMVGGSDDTAAKSEWEDGEV